MKKLICLLLVTIFVCSLLTGCIGTYTCDLCGKEDFGLIVTEEIFGQEYVFCDECADAIHRWQK